MTDDNDLTDRYEEIVASLEGKTLEEVWKENPDPPESYGKPDSKTVVEEIEELMWVWHTENKDAVIKFDGKSIEIEDS